MAAICTNTGGRSFLANATFTSPPGFGRNTCCRKSLNHGLIGLGPKTHKNVLPGRSRTQAPAGARRPGSFGNHAGAFQSEK